jgi:hypothetical protein
MSKVKFFSMIVLFVIAVATISIPNHEVSAGVYNRTNAVAYADTWAKARNSAYPNYGTGSDCVDCTNYISQVLNQGGLPQVPGANDVFHWYTYTDIFGAKFGSKSWAATDQFNVYATQFPAKFQQHNTIATLSAGDVFVMDLASNDFVGPDHARVIVGTGVIQEGDLIGQTALLANQHCTDRKRVRWNYNLPAGTSVWGWHVIY